MFHLFELLAELMELGEAHESVQRGKQDRVFPRGVWAVHSNERVDGVQQGVVMDWRRGRCLFDDKVGDPPARLALFA